MAISVNWPIKRISVPKDYLTLLSGTLYELDTDQFRRDLRGLEASVEGMPFVRTHDHNTTYTVAGIEYARKVEIVNSYEVEFENGFYSVSLIGSNNNIFDVGAGVLVQNNVQVIPNNSAGLIVVRQGSGLTTEESTMLRELWKLQGLDINQPLTMTQAQRIVDNINLALGGDGETLTTVTRQP